MYSDDDMLMLSGIQHFRFCPRQWALIHIEQQWSENQLTAEGRIIHSRVDDPFYRQKCGNFLSLRSVGVASHLLGLYGITDVVELHPSKDSVNSIRHPKYPGLWKPYPVEYKRGKPKQNEVDEVQLAAQVMCLEEQYGIKISHGAFFYAEHRHRIEVTITNELRDIVRNCAVKMHKMFESGLLPPIIYGICCNNCSLKDICLPKVSGCSKVSHYLNKYLYEETS